MQTTLRIDDQLYRSAKAQAAREGTTLTRFLEEGIRLRLGIQTTPAGDPPVFRTYSTPCPQPDEEEILRVAEEDSEKYDRSKLGMS